MAVKYEILYEKEVKKDLTSSDSCRAPCRKLKTACFKQLHYFETVLPVYCLKLKRNRGDDGRNNK